jgi:hypothetical protein
MLALLSPAQAQDKFAPHAQEIKALHADYIRAQQAALIPVYKAYLEKLAQLRKLYFAQGDSQSVSILDKEITRISNEATSEEASLNSSQPVPIEIVSALYGNLQKGAKPANVTSVIKKAYEQGQTSVVVNNGLAGKDPAPLVVKAIKVTYLVGTVKQEKIFPEGHVLNFVEDLR